MHTRKMAKVLSFQTIRTFTGKMTRGLSLRMVFSLLFQDTLLTPRCPNNRRELRVHATVYIYACVVITYSGVQINRVSSSILSMVS